MTCTRCGSDVVPGSSYCGRCGNPVSAPAPAAVLRRPGVVTVLAILDIVGGAFALLLALLLVGAGGRSEERLLLLAVGSLLGLAGALQVACGIGLWNLRSWGRVLQIVLAAIGLLGFPVGTVVSILILVYLAKPGVKVLFSEKHPNRLTPAEVAAAWEVTQGSGTGVAVAIVLGLVVGVAVLGITTAIAVPNLLTAIQRAKQKRTMHDMTTIAATLEERYRRDGRLPEIRSMEEYVGVIGSEGAKLRRDGWANEFRILVTPEGYALASAGKDGVFSEERLDAYRPARTREFNADLVMRDGEWLVAPEGVPK